MSTKSIKMLKKSDTDTCSEIPYVLANDLLPDLLIHLPVKSIVRFCLVCKRWYALIIKDPIFRRLLISNQNPSPAGILIIQGLNMYPNTDYYPLSSSCVVPLEKLELDFGGERCTMLAQQSCNGLFLSSCWYDEDSCRYFVWNPTTRKYIILPKHNLFSIVISACLAFDPLRSSYYNVVAVVRLSGYSQHMYQIFIYSSNTGSWRASGDPFPRKRVQQYERGVYWNGAVHWIRSLHSYPSFRFNIDNELLQTMPSVPMTKSGKRGEWRNSYYVGETRGHLYFVESGFKELDIYEMKRDYSGWFLKLRVNLNELAINYRKVVVFSIVCGEDDNVSFLVLRVPGKIIWYNLVSNTCKTLHDIRVHESLDNKAFHYFESLCSV